MKIKISQADLLAALESCATVADSKSPFPWGSCVIIEAETKARALTCRASNSVQAVKRSLVIGTGSIVKPGSVMVNAKDMLQRVGALDAGDVTIEELPGSVRISQGGARYSLPKRDVSEAQAQSIVDPQGSEIDAKAFGALLARVAPMMSADESRGPMYGIGVSTSGGKLWAKASDGGSGAMAPLTFDGSLTALIPSPAVKHLQSVLVNVEGSSRVAVVGNALYVFADGLTYSTLLTGAAFPPLEQIIPARKGPSMLVDRSAMLDAVNAVKIGGACEKRIMLRPNEKGIMLRGQADDSSAGSRQVDCDCTVKAFSSGVEHVSRLLKFLRGDAVTIHVDDGDRKVGGGPGLMVAEEEGALFVVMPRQFYADDLAPDSPEWT